MLVYGLTKLKRTTLGNASGTNRASPNTGTGLKILESDSFGFLGTPDFNVWAMRLTASATLRSSGFREDRPDGRLKSEALKPYG
jgi:hypothetical protein